MINNTLRKFIENLVVGKGIQGNLNWAWKKFIGLWKKFWREIDRIIGLAMRELYKYTVPMSPNKVFFFTQEFHYCCNPKYICEELLHRNADVDIVWRVRKNETKDFPEGVRRVNAGTLKYYREIYSSPIIVANSYIFNDQTMFLKKGQILIQTWHGSLGIKRFGKHDMKDGWRRVWASVVTGKMTDYCITNSSFVSGSLRNTYWPKTPMLEYGHPRNDLFFSNYAEKRTEIRRRLCEQWGVSEESRFVMYGPTFRDKGRMDSYTIDFKTLLSELRERFGGEWVLLLRYHPSLLNRYKSLAKQYGDGNLPIINVSSYPDMQELISVTDVAITDYSSWIYDFMLLRRPGFIYAADIDEYNTERGFCYPLETTPFPIARDNEEMSENIRSFDETVYMERLDEFLKDKGCVEDGHASERVVDLILRLLDGNADVETS